MAESPHPDWLPDWRDASGYPDPESTSRQQWAWEFLRRNSQYQSDWNQREMPDYAVYFKQQKIDPSDKEIYMLVLGTKWGLACYAPDPSIDVPEVLLFLETDVAAATTYEDVQKIGRMPYSPGDWPFVNVVFDLELPIHSQIETTKEFLRKTQKNFIDRGKVELKKGSHRFPGGRLLRDYLRCLDGEAGGASLKEIAEVVFPMINNDYPDLQAQQKVRDNLTAAKKLVNSKYRYLAK
jgi:hypothetical protein